MSPADADRCVLRLVATRRCGPVRSEERPCGARRCGLHPTNANRPRTWCRMSGGRTNELGVRLPRIGAPKAEHRLSVNPPRTLRMANGSLNASPGSLYCAAADEHRRRSRVAGGAVGRWRGWASGPLQQRRRLEREWPRYRTQRGDPHG